MQSVTLPERPDWKAQAEEAGFTFHTMYGQNYWDESSAYRFTLSEIEDCIEDPATELHAMCREAVAHVVASEELMERFCIPEAHRDLVAASWRAGEPELFGRFDMIHDGHGPAKMIEYNADTPTSLYEASSFQWTWLEQQRDAGVLPPGADQFNGIFEALVARFRKMFVQDTDIHFASVGGRDANFEDYATVETMAFAAREAGLGAHYTPIEQIGVTTQGQFADAEDRVIGTLFKLYPWEDMLRDPFADNITGASCRFLEPPWKALLSNKAILPLLWEMFEGHPNLLPSFFLRDLLAQTDIVRRATDQGLFAEGTVKKPLFSREGASVTISGPDNEVIEASTDRGYDQHRMIVQAYKPLPVFGGFRPILGVWVVGETACGLGIRDDRNRITQDLSIFRPHFIEG